MQWPSEDQLANMSPDELRHLQRRMVRQPLAPRLQTLCDCCVAHACVCAGWQRQSGGETSGTESDARSPSPPRRTVSFHTSTKPEGDSNNNAAQPLARRTLGRHKRKV